MSEISNLRSKYKVIVGDFNLPLVDWTNLTSPTGIDDISNSFIEKVRDGFLAQHVNDITRFRGINRGSILDLILSNDETIIEDVKIGSPLGKSDHSCIQFLCDIQEERDNSKKVIHMYEKANYQLMRQKLNIDWKDYLSSEDTMEGKWNKFKNKMQATIDECVPKKTLGELRKGRKRLNETLPMNRKLWSKIKKKQRLWEQLKEMRGRSDSGWNEQSEPYISVEKDYRRVNNQVRRETRNAVKNKEQEIARNVKDNPKVFWKYIQSKTRTKSRIPELYVDADKRAKTVSDKEKVEVLAEKFSDVFIKEPDGEIPRGKREDVPVTILRKLVITKEKIRKIIKKLKRNKSPGPDHLHPRIIKEVMEEILEPFQILFDFSFAMRQLPQDWVIADITPIFKKGNKSEPGNYRPVSLTSVACKIMETLIREEIMSHMKRHKLFSKKQYGFISGRSTVLQLIKVLDRWTEVIDEGHAVDVIYCDFQKAFDRVPHKRLQEKISCCGIGDEYLGWIREFLTTRTQRVVINGEASSWREVISGVPQGSVLGPLLFVIFINDLPDCLKNQSEIYLYADDTKIFRKIVSRDDCEKLQEDLNEMKLWTEKWLLSFHPEKSKYMRIGKTKVEDEGYYLTNHIERSTSEKDIGVTVDNRLSFSAHLSEKINKANKIVGLIRRSFVSLDAKMFKSLYIALARPHLEYANQVWNPHLKKDIEAIENVQRRATKLLPQMKELSYEERLRVLNLPTLTYRRSRGDLIETYKILSGKYDGDCCNDIFQIREESMTRGNSKKIFKPRTRLNIRKYSFPCRVIDNWNGLPNWVIESDSVESFERKLDKYWKNQDQFYNYDAKIMSATQSHHNRSDVALELEPQAH